MSKIPISTSKKITYISFLAAVGVMYIHAIDYVSYNSDIMGWHLISYLERFIGVSLFGHASVSMFFFISGYLFFNNIDGLKQWREKIKKRINTLLIPYLFWAFIGWAIFAVISLLPGLSSNVNSKVSFSFNEIINIFVLLKYSHHLWYIQNLIMYFLLSVVFIYLFRSKKISMIVLGVSIIISVCGFEGGFFMTTRFTTFFAGCLIQKFFPHAIGVKNKKESIIACILLFVVSLILTSVQVRVIDKLWYFIAPLLFWFAFDILGLPAVDGKTYDICKHSFYVYCAHGTTIECIKQVFSIFYNSSIIMLLSYVFSPILILVILGFAMYVGKRTVPEFVRIVTGNRS